MVNDTVSRALEENNGTITPAIADKYSINRMTLSRMAAQGLLERIARGIYLDPDVFEDELYNLQLRFSRGIFSHDTALFLHGMTDRTPIAFQMTLPRSYNATNLNDYAIEPIYQIPDLYNLGITTVRSPGNHLVKVYDVERTLCDIVRLPNQSETGVIVQAMREYVEKSDKNISQLFRYAQQLHVEKRIRQYMEILL